MSSGGNGGGPYNGISSPFSISRGNKVDLTVLLHAMVLFQNRSRRSDGLLSTPFDHHLDDVLLCCVCCSRTGYQVVVKKVGQIWPGKSYIINLYVGLGPCVTAAQADLLCCCHLHSNPYTHHGRYYTAPHCGVQGQEEEEGV